MFLCVLCDMCEPCFLLLCCCFRKEGQDTKDELQKRNLRHELEERERRHFSSRDKSYNGKTMLPIFIVCQYFLVLLDCPLRLLQFLFIFVVIYAYSFFTSSPKKRCILILINTSLLQMTEIVGRVAIFCWKVCIPVRLTLIK